MSFDFKLDCINYLNVVSRCFAIDDIEVFDVIFIFLFAVLLSLRLGD